MQFGFGTKWVMTLGIVVAFSPLVALAQEIAPPPLPPLPGIAPPPPQKAEIPKLPQLKTIPEIPPAKQVAAKDAPVEAGWLDKAKGMWARFQDKPAEVKPKTTATTKPTPPPTTIAKSGIVLLPPPPMEQPIVEALNLDTETPKVDPDVFAFDDAEKKQEKTATVSVAKPIIPPLPPVAKKDSAENVSVPVLPNPIKKLPKTEVAVAPPPSLPSVVQKEPEKKVTLAVLPPPPVAKNEDVAVSPSLPAISLPKIDVPAKSSLSQIAPPPPAVPAPRYTPKIAEAKPTTPAPKKKEPEKGWLDALTEKALEFKDAAKTKISDVAQSGGDKNLAEKLMTKPTLPTLKKENKEEEIATPKAPTLPPLKAPSLPQIALPAVPAPAPKQEIALPAPKAPALPAITMPVETKTEISGLSPLAPPPPAVPVPQYPQKAPALPQVAMPELKIPEPEVKEKIAMPAPKAPAFPQIAMPELEKIEKPKQKASALPKPEMAATEPTIPEIPLVPEMAKIPPKMPEVVAKPKAPLPLPDLALGDLKLPNDVKMPPKLEPEPERIALPLKPKRDEPPQEIVKQEPEKEIVMEDPIVAEGKPVENADAFEFDELNNKGKKAKKTDEPVEAIIADIEADDPAFKFWKGHNFKTQVLPDVLNRKEYEVRNSHLPKALYREDLEQGLFVAVARGDLNAIRAMLDQGVDVEAKNAIGDTPLVHAAINGQAGAVRVLLARGANPNTPNVHGNTAMQVAAERGREDIIDALFEMGAKSTADYRDPLTPLQSGVGRGYASIYNAMLDGENPKKKQLDERNRALQALADAGPNPRVVISQGMPNLSKQVIDDQARKQPSQPLTFDELERQLAYQEYVRKTGDDPAANRPADSTIPKLISPAGAKATPMPIPYTNPQPQQSQVAPPAGYIPPQAQEPIVGLPPQAR